MNMKTKHIFSVMTIIILSGFFFMTSCKKRQAFKNEDGQTSIDNRNVQSENDNTVSDINNVISNQPLMNGRTASPSSTNGVLNNICGLVLDTTGAHIGTITLNFNGTSCNNRTRTGSIKLTILDYASGKRWKQAGCVMKVDYINYKVTRTSDGKFVMLNGTQNLTNISGGSFLALLLNLQPNISASVTGTNLLVTFDGSKTATYNIHRKFTYTWANSVLKCVGEGIGSYNGLNNLENWGKTRDGDDFTSQVISPVVWNSSCGAWAPIEGQVHIKVDSKEFEVKGTFGVNSAGNVVAVGANQCPYGWKIDWTYKNKSNSKVIGYN
jgi:hypothetical protein